MSRLLPRQRGIYNVRRPRAPGPEAVPFVDPLISCDWSCPGECKEFYEGLKRLESICSAETYDEFENLILDLEYKLAHEYWSPLKHDIIRSGLTQVEGSFLSMVLREYPHLLWRDIILFDGMRNSLAVDYILDRIRTAGHECEALEALGYVELVNKLRRSIPYVYERDVRDLLRLFQRRYTEAFGAPYRR